MSMRHSTLGTFEGPWRAQPGAHVPARAGRAAEYGSAPSRGGDQPGAALIGEVRVRPLDQDAEPVPESGEIHDVEEEPEEPRWPTPHLEPGELSYCAMTSDGGEVALV